MIRQSIHRRKLAMTIIGLISLLGKAILASLAASFITVTPKLETRPFQITSTGYAGDNTAFLPDAYYPYTAASGVSSYPFFSSSKHTKISPISVLLAVVSTVIA